MQWMKAQKAFRLSETGIFVQPGSEFETRDPNFYESRGMAFPIRSYPRPQDKPSIQNEAAVAGPFVLDGGETGAIQSSSSSVQDQARQESTYRQSGKKRSAS